MWEMITEAVASPPLMIEESGVLSPEAKALLEHIVWGTEGALYWVKNYPESLSAIPDLRYLYLKKNGRLIGLRIMAPKRVRINGQSCQAVYNALFAIDPSERGKGYGKRLAQTTLEYSRSYLHGKGLVYAFTEAANVRSSGIKIAQGYQPIGRFHTIAFSRFFPRKSQRTNRLPEERRNEMVQRLSEQYASHALADFATSVLPERYYVLQEGREIVAGLQVAFQHWKIMRLEGAGGFIALHAVPHIPLLRDLLNPADFRFIRIGNIYFRQDRPAAVYELIESVLATHRLKTAISFLDKTSPAYQALARSGRFGIVNQLTETAVDVTAFLQGFSPVEIDELRRQPLAISLLDI